MTLEINAHYVLGAEFGFNDPLLSESLIECPSQLIARQKELPS